MDSTHQPSVSPTDMDSQDKSSSNVINKDSEDENNKMDSEDENFLHTLYYNVK